MKPGVYLTEHLTHRSNSWTQKGTRGTVVTDPKKKKKTGENGTCVCRVGDLGQRVVQDD